MTKVELDKLLSYDQDTGLFTWLVTRGSAKIGSVPGTNSKKENYVQIRINRILYPAHCLAVLTMTGNMPLEGYEVDHKNHIKSDNKWKNLRVVTHQDNTRNQKKSKANTSGVTGVSWTPNSNKWRSCIYAGGNRKHLGYFSHIFEAACARKAAEIEYGYHVNHGKG